MIARILRCTVAAALLSLLSPNVFSIEIGGITLPDEVTVQNKQLILNGAGLRKAFFFKVYAMGLYLESRSSDASTIISSKGSKRIIMRFSRDVGRDKLADAWQDGFEKNDSFADKVQGELDTFKQAMSDVKEGDSIVIDFIGPRVEVFVRNQIPVTITGSAFQEALLSVWLGPEPPNSALKTGILGN